MSERVVGNYIRAHRRRCGLSQRELGHLVGYENEFQTSRHERSVTTPPLLIALAYEVVFQISVAEIFVGFHTTVSAIVEANLEELKKDLERQHSGGRVSRATMQKLQWLNKRRIPPQTQ